MPVQLQEHQKTTLDFFVNSPNRGIFLLHGTGSGKTLSAIAIAEHFKWYRECLVIAPKSLHDNFRKELKRFGTKSQSRYRYMSSNAGNLIDKLETSTDEITGIDVKSLRLDNKMIIIDESHRLLVGMANGSKNATALYDMLMRAKNCRIVMLTASGIINNIFEIVPALNICKGPIQTDEGEWTTLLPESAEGFAKHFIDERNPGKLKNVGKLKNRINGLVSYKGDLFEREVLSFYSMIASKIEQEYYPTRLPIKIVPVPMSARQWGAYEQAREKERLETKNAIIGSGWKKGDHIVLNDRAISGGELKHSSLFSKSTSYRIRSRQISNIYKPEDVTEDEINEKIGTHSPKIKSIGDKIKPGEKTLIYSNFVQAGVVPMASYLERLGYIRFVPGETSKESIHGYFGVYTGAETTDDRTTTLNEYNKPDSALNILLISSSGAEGLSTKGTRVVAIMEPYWNWERSLQVMARGIRYKSHEHLPEAERNVQVYIYVAVPPKNVKPIEKTTDAYLFTSGVSKYEINQEMIKLMASASIECPQANRASNFECFRCETKNGVPLFLNDINKDMQYPLPCKQEVDSFTAKEIKLSDQLYYLTDDNRIFVQQDDHEYNEIKDVDARNWILSRA